MAPFSLSLSSTLRFPWYPSISHMLPVYHFFFYQQHSIRLLLRIERHKQRIEPFSQGWMCERAFF
jgi:hypothetical protein